jgi:hypothetical protein
MFKENVKEDDLNRGVEHAGCLAEESVDLFERVHCLKNCKRKGESYRRILWISTARHKMMVDQQTTVAFSRKDATKHSRTGMETLSAVDSKS